jgi:hypothetical protein
MTCIFLYAAGDLPLSTFIAQWVALAVKVAALIALGYIGKQCFARLLTTMEQERPGVDTSWGGLGGSLGGWSVSKSLAWLIVNIFVLVVFLALASQVGDNLSNTPNASTAAEQRKPAEAKEAGKQAAEPAPLANTEAGNKPEPSKTEPPKVEPKTETPSKKDAKPEAVKP